MRTLSCASKWFRLALGACLALSVMLGARTGAACSCAEPRPFPDGASPVPRNAKVWVPVEWARLWVCWRRDDDSPESLSEALELVGPAGKAVPVQATWLRFSWDDYVVLTPLEELASGEHSVQGSGAKARHPGVPLSRPFTVADSRLTEAPAPPQVRILGWVDEGEDDDDMCGATRAAHLEVASSGWLLVYEERVASDAAPDGVSYAQLRGGELWLGDGSCISEVASGTRFIRFGTIDLAGKFSGFGPLMAWAPPWRPEPNLRTPPPSLLSAKGSRGCACDMSSAPGSSRLALLVAAMMLARRVRRVRK